MTLRITQARVGYLFLVIGLVLPAGSLAKGVSDSRGPDSLDVSTALELEEIQSQKFEGGGRYRGFRTHKFDSHLTDEQRRLLEKLESIGYLSGSREAPALANVTIHDKNRACSGLNFFTSGHGPYAHLMDIAGNVLHEWYYPFEDVWPDYPLSEDAPGTQFWRRAYLYENGDILVIYEGLGIVRLDKDSNLIWANPNRAHHDLEVLANGDIYVVTREAGILPRVDPVKPVLEDFISVLDRDGNEKRRVSLLECFENSGRFDRVYANRASRVGDIFHTNTVEVLDGRIAERVPAFRAGNVLTSMRALNAIAVVDMDKEEVVWAKRGNFRRQHDPKILVNGHLLLFDNDRRGPRQSWIQEYNPARSLSTRAAAGPPSDCPTETP